jgi:hypothetical protein
LYGFCFDSWTMISISFYNFFIIVEKKVYKYNKKLCYLNFNVVMLLDILMNLDEMEKIFHLIQTFLFFYLLIHLFVFSHSDGKRRKKIEFKIGLTNIPFVILLRNHVCCKQSIKSKARKERHQIAQNCVK